MKGITKTTAVALNRARTMAPSQKAKMEKIEGITSQIIVCTAREDISKNGVQVHAGEKFLLVQSDRFVGWYYLVSWTDTGIGDCTCGKPFVCEHTIAACDYTRNYRAIAPVVVMVTPEEVQQHAEELLDGMKMSVEEIKRRIIEGTRKQAEEQEEVLHIDSRLPQPNEQGRYQTAMDWIIATDASEVA